MAIRVQIPSPLRPLTGGQEELEAEATSVTNLIERLEERHQGFKDRLFDASGKLRNYVRIFVNDEDIRSLKGEATPLKNGDSVAIVPAIAGGL